MSAKPIPPPELRDGLIEAKGVTQETLSNVVRHSGARRAQVRLSAGSGEVRLEVTYAQNWNFLIQRSFLTDYLVEAQYVGTKGTRVVRFIEANPALFGLSATSQNADQRRIHAVVKDFRSAPINNAERKLFSYL